MDSLLLLCKHDRVRKGAEDLSKGTKLEGNLICQGKLVLVMGKNLGFVFHRITVWKFHSGL
jgi:hypothetical protein